jgi:hypothetical protein
LQKYRNSKSKLDGRVFDSKAEMERYQELAYLEKHGEIRDLILQPVFMIQEGFSATKNGKNLRVRGVTYRADYSYYIGDKLIIEDMKGFETPVFKIKKKFIIKNYREAIYLITGRKNGETIIKEKWNDTERKD